MSSYPFLTLFSSTLFTRTLLALSSSHWLIIWAALELNMLSFIPLISLSSWSRETEASVKYFIFQALGSSILLLSSFTSILPYLLPLAIIIKLGIAPFHFWFPPVINSISWPLCFTLSTWQKVTPLAILISSSSPSHFFILISSLRAIVGGWGGLNQTQIRPLLAYSSIGHIGWILAASMASLWVRAFYFVVYSIHSLLLFSYFWFFNLISVKTLSSTINSNPSMVILLIFMLLSLGGLPPLVGFIPKLYTLSTISSIVAPFFLILGSLINIFYYLNITLASLLRKHYNLAPSSINVAWFFLFITMTTPIRYLFLYAMTLFN